MCCAMVNEIIENSQYKEWLKELKSKVSRAQIKAAVTVNSTLLEFYWNLGSEIVEKQQSTSWGSGFLKKLSHDLMAEFPDMKGFSKRNLEHIRRWYLFYSKESIAKQAASQLLRIPWWHNVIIVQKCKTVEDALFYVQKTIENNWSRSVLTHQIESRLFERQGSAITNFDDTLPKPQSDLATQIIKDPYNFDFLTLREDYKERELEQNLIEHITKFLLELGAGFAYLGKQVPMQVGGRDFYLDLLFYHTKLHCYVVIELKTTDFEPEHAGKLNFYIKAVDETVKGEQDNPTIGMLLCKNKDRLVVEYALSDIQKPIGVSEYQLTQALPDEFKSSLPSIEEIEEELNPEFHNED